MQEHAKTLLQLGYIWVCQKTLASIPASTYCQKPHRTAARAVILPPKPKKQVPLVLNDITLPDTDLLHLPPNLGGFHLGLGHGTNLASGYLVSKD